MHADERIIAIGPDAESPHLSVLTPFHRHDPSALLARLANAPDGVEFILIDDGSASAELLAGVIGAAERVGAPVRVIVWGRNRGRAAARNRLIEEARGAHVLFLDADMIPDSSRFLSIWLGVLSTQRPLVAFGGLSTKHVKSNSDTALHLNVFARSDCAPARIRALKPAQSTASANLAVRRDFLAAHPFDARFTGWGFEDTDWAISAAKRVRILHVDNPATHAGLDDVATLMRKNAEAGPNFARLAQKHPDTVRRFAAYRAAIALKAAPARSALRRLAAFLAADDAGLTPMPVRRAAFKLHRATYFAENLA
jgi:glycosyltransferase involved in cell wall biosynthesis